MIETNEGSFLLTVMPLILLHTEYGKFFNWNSRLSALSTVIIPSNRELLFSELPLLR